MMCPVFKNASISPHDGIDAAVPRRVTEIALAAVVLGARRAADIAEVLAGGLTLRIYMITMVAIQPTRV